MSEQQIAIDTNEAEILSSPTKPQTKDRLTYTLNLYHEHVGDQPSNVQLVGQKLLDHDEQTWTRRIKVGKDSIPIDLGWMDEDKAGLVCPENQAGKNQSVNPTPEEREHLESLIIHVLISDSTNPLLVPPGWPLMFWPTHHSSIRLYCPTGEAVCHVMVCPK